MSSIGTGGPVRGPGVFRAGPYERKEEAPLVSDVLAGSVSRPSWTSELEQLPVEPVPVTDLVLGHSARVAGEDAGHTRTLAGTEAELPPIVVHRPTMRVVDGAHRVRAAVLRSEETIGARFVEGTVQDAFVLAVRLNSRHGMPLSGDDRTAAARRIVASHPEWSDRRIAGVTGVAPGTVGALRRRSTGQSGQSNARTGADGRTRPLSAATGRETAARVILERPNATLRDVAARAGIALSTAKDVRDRVREGRDPVPPRLRNEYAAVREQAAPRTAARAESGAAAAARPGHGACGRSTDKRSALARLCKDPALRHTELGRSLLQLLSTQAIDEDTWQRLAGSVPAHCSDVVAWVAQQCAQEWLRFAQEVRRAGGAGGAGGQT
ncbi:ParB/RepB/Spo0J family partition protein [Kitasatospora sp. NPDC002040]|uniref:ParB/RepB/Spo0J family partition protein n=1 Tax=Kitasatospora sp. NPDC002040 TaxID=3154661 RepID=UPI0033254AE3